MRPVAGLSSNRLQVPVQCHAGASLAEYLRESPQYFEALGVLPQGGRLRPLDLRTGLVGGLALRLRKHIHLPVAGRLVARVFASPCVP
jgi:hypothetical protein